MSEAPPAIVSPTAPPVGRPRGGLTGLLSGAAGLAAAELLAGIVHGVSSPIISVGNVVVDHVPVSLKEFAIRQFGTNDKQALLIGIAMTVTAFAIALGVVSRSRRIVGVVGLIAFACLGAVASLAGRTGTARDVWPSFAAGIVAVAVFVYLSRTDRRANVSHKSGVTEATARSERPIDPTDARSIDRRAFLGRAAFTAAAAATAGTVGRRLQRSGSAIAQRAKLVLPKARKPLPPIPGAVGVPELAATTPFVTPNRSFYRIDTALVVPRIDASTWKLTVKGMVGNPVEFSYQDLLRRDLIERDITLTCVSNEVGGVLMGNARWLGVPLRELLEEARIDPRATQIVGRSVDGWTSGFPTSVVLDGRDAMVAVGMNGEPLPFAHGYPARLIVPGLYGYVSATKWLKSIECKTLEDFDAYWVPRGYAKLAPIKLASRIDVPRGLATVQSGKVAIAGVAWDQRHGIEAVEVRIDGGVWQGAELAGEQSIDTWRQWRHVWDASAGQHEIAVRAINHAGNMQIEQRRPPLPDGATGWHSVVVFVRD